MAEVVQDKLTVQAGANPLIEISCQNNPPSQFVLGAWNSNAKLESQIQFLGEFSIVAVPGSQSDPNRDGKGPRIIYHDSGVLVVHLTQAVPTITLDPAAGIQLSHPNGQIHLEMTGNEIAPNNWGGGLINVMDGGGKTTISLTGHTGTIETGAKASMSGQNGGLLQLFHPNGGNPHIELIANEVAPENSGGGLINVADGAGNLTIQLNGQKGTINAYDLIIAQADCAEDFEVALGETAEPGSVMVIDDQGVLRESCQAYDRKVAGVISGAGKYKSGITLGRHSVRGRAMPLALTGRVYCKVDATYGPIEVGDLLVTSPTRAHAMKASDSSQAFGAVIGKALASCKSGLGLLPILVSLQ